jgi:hypothetical protein
MKKIFSAISADYLPFFAATLLIITAIIINQKKGLTQRSFLTPSPLETVFQPTPTPSPTPTPEATSPPIQTATFTPTPIGTTPSIVGPRRGGDD